MFKLNFFFALFFAIICSACSEHIYSSMTKDANLKKYKTFALLPDIDTCHKSICVKDTKITRSIMQDVTDEMMLRGYKLDTVNPELLVLVHTLLVKKEQ